MSMLDPAMLLLYSVWMIALIFWIAVGYFALHAARFIYRYITAPSKDDFSRK